MTLTGRDYFEHHLALTAIERFILRLCVAALSSASPARAQLDDLPPGSALSLTVVGRRTPRLWRRAVERWQSPEARTPAPMTKTCAAETVPAAVISLGTPRQRVGAEQDAFVPAMVAIGESVHLCARVIRGITPSTTTSRRWRRCRERPAARRGIDEPMTV